MGAAQYAVEWKNMNAVTRTRDNIRNYLNETKTKYCFGRHT